MDKDILERLQIITTEEQAILDGRTTIDRNLYRQGQGNTINAQKLLAAGKLITPDFTALQNADNWTELMVVQEELKTMPFGEIWTEYCRQCGAPANGEWFATVKQYEKDVLSKRV